MSSSSFIYSIPLFTRFVSRKYTGNWLKSFLEMTSRMFLKLQIWAYYLDTISSSLFSHFSFSTLFSFPAMSLLKKCVGLDPNFRKPLDVALIWWVLGGGGTSGYGDRHTDRHLDIETHRQTYWFVYRMRQSQFAFLWNFKFSKSLLFLLDIRISFHTDRLKPKYG